MPMSKRDLTGIWIVGFLSDKKGNDGRYLYADVMGFIDKDSMTDFLCNKRGWSQEEVEDCIVKPDDADGWTADIWFQSFGKYK